MREYDLWGNEITNVINMDSKKKAKNKANYTSIFDPYKEWVDMPEYISEKIRPYHLMTIKIGDQTIKARFKTELDLMQFNHRMGFLISSKHKEVEVESIEYLADRSRQKITPRTKSMWYPYKSHLRKEKQFRYAGDTYEP